MKNEDGKLADQFVIEPITANSLECMAVGERGPGGQRAVAGRGRRLLRPGVPACWPAYVPSSPPPPLPPPSASHCISPPPHTPPPHPTPSPLHGCRRTGASTSFKHVFSLRLGEALARDKSALPPEFAAGSYCENFEARCDACARTWMRPHALDNLL